MNPRKGCNKSSMNLSNLIIILLSISICQGEQQYFIKEPEDITAISGEKVILPCNVENKQGLLQWTKDGFGLGVIRDLPGYPSYSLVGGDENREWNLEISSVSIGDDADYQCQVGASGDVPAIRSKPVHLTVMVPPGEPKILQGEVVEAEVGVESVLECTSGGGRPAGEIVWRDEDGKEILTNTITRTKKLLDRKTFETISVLTLKPKLQDNQKKIFCSVSSDINPSPISTSTKLRLKYKPKVELKYGSEALNEGDSFTATCKAEAYPELVEYSWYFNGQLMDSEQAETLKILKVSRKHENGLVECQAKNSVGMARDQATISFRYGPTMLSNPSSVRMREGQTAHFSCLADGNPTPRYVWTADNSNAAISFSPNLTLVASAQTAGNYKCQAMVEGFPAVVSDHAKLSILAKPSIKSDKEQFGKLGGQIKLECRVTSSANYNHISWDKNGISIPSTDKKYKITVTDKEDEHVSELYIENADLSDFTTYGCKATNEIGSDFLVVSMKEIETEKSSHILYIVIGVFAIVIILLLLTLCIVLSKRRNRSNLELIKAANDQAKRREKMKDCEANSFDENYDDDAEGKLSGLEPDLILPFKKGNQLPRNILSEEEEEPSESPKFMLTPLEDESQTYYTSHKPFMIQRFEKQPLSSNPSFSSIDYSCSPASNSFDSGNPDMESQYNSLSKQERPFLTKNVYVNGRNKFTKPTNNTKANNKYALEDDSDDLYVTLLPSADPIV